MSPRVVRTKTTELTAVADGRFRLVARLTDVSRDCDWGPAGQDGVIHDFEVEGEIAGDDLIVTSLGVRAVTHPYASCPAIVPGCAALAGRSLASGWRRTVLEMLGGTAGCTHVTSLLVGLAEVRTSVFFLRMNQRVPYTPATRGRRVDRRRAGRRTGDRRRVPRADQGRARHRQRGAAPRQANLR
jgi:hypothetical protein